MINQLIGIISGGCLAYGVFKVVDSFTRYTEAKEKGHGTTGGEFWGVITGGVFIAIGSGTFFAQLFSLIPGLN